MNLVQYRLFLYTTFKSSSFLSLSFFFFDLFFIPVSLCSIFKNKSMLRKTRVCLLESSSNPGSSPYTPCPKPGSLCRWSEPGSSIFPRPFWPGSEKSGERKDAQNKDGVIISFESKPLLLSSVRFKSEI